MTRWDEREALLLDEARRDLEAGHDVRPCLLAMAGEQPLLLAFLRDFAEGHHLDALVEVLALAAPLGADRLVVSMPGRAASLADPVPPVVRGLGDLRQRVLVVDEVDAASGPPRSCSSLFPFDAGSSPPRWEEPLRASGPTGPVSVALLVAIRERHRLHATDGELIRQAQRCAGLGHMLLLSAVTYERLVPS